MSRFLVRVMIRHILLVGVLWAVMPVVCFSQSSRCPFRKNYTVSHHGSTGCINSSSMIPCPSLSYLIQNVHKCANIQILDDQILSASLLFSINSFELLIGSEKPHQIVAIQCENNSGLIFDSSQEISLADLHFINCSLNVTESASDISVSLDSKLSSVTFIEAKGVEILGCVFDTNMGSGLLLIDVNGIKIEDSVFTGAEYDVESRSGGIVIRQSLPFIGVFNYSIVNCNFTGNVHMPIQTVCPSNDFIGSEGYHGGAIDMNLLTNASTINITIMDSHFLYNRAFYGGAICMTFSGLQSKNIINLIRCIFKLNSACTKGGAVAVLTNTYLEHYNDSDNLGSVYIHSCQFTNNSAFWGGGIAVYRCLSCSKITFSASHSLWSHNNAYSSGYGVAIGGNHTSTESVNQYAIKAFHAKVVFFECRFIHNTNKGFYQNTDAVGALAVTSCELIISGKTCFELNQGTALLIRGLSRVTFMGEITFNQNFGINGGAIRLVDGSHIRINSTSNIRFIGNNAVVMGGAVYSNPVSETYGNPFVPCLFDFDEMYSHINVTFLDNTASNSDQSIFVGNPSLCNQSILLKLFIYSPSISNQVLTVPEKISFNTIPEMSNEMLVLMLGEKFFLNPVVIDVFQHKSTSSGSLALLNSDGSKIPITTDLMLVGPSLIGMNNYTKNVEFFIKGFHDVAYSDLLLEFIYKQVSTYRSGSTELKIRIIPCKFGYKYSFESLKCECIVNKNMVCPFSNLTMVCIKQGYWYDEEKEKTVVCPAVNCNFANNRCPGLGLECPTSPGYCIIANNEDPCWEGRGKYLCSQCKNNYSFTYGAFKCVPSDTCNLKNTFLIIFVVIIYWLLFVVALMLILTLNLSVGAGFMYGIVYYFSVVTLFTDNKLRNSTLRYILNISISMTQFDPRMLGVFIPLCFIGNLDEGLHHQMLHYLAPLFIISTVLAIIWLSRYCRCPRRISLSENSPIHAICMLILFSYTSLSHTNFQILHPIVIEREIYVLESPTTKYFDTRKHLPYALFALSIEIFISLPTCFLLLIAPCISSRINLVKLRLKPILDEFQACYQPEYRWFAGFYFLARQLMYLANILPLSDVLQPNLLLQCISLFILVIHISFQPYKSKWLNLIDTILLVDISLMSVYTSSTLHFTGLNWMVYEVTPYVLILVPSCYLFGIIAVLFLKKLFTVLRSIRCCKVHDNVATVTFDAVNHDRSTEVGETVKRSSSFFKDEGEREPLLAEFSTEHLEHHSHERGWVVQLLNRWRV